MLKPVLATPVPPRAPESVPVQPKVSELACSSAVVGVPPSVSVTLVSSVLVSAAPVTVPHAPQLAMPVPSVSRHCPLLPPEVGHLNVHVPAASTAWVVTVPLVAPAYFNWPVTELATPRVSAGLTHVRFAEPPNADELLNWTCVFEPPGVPLPALHAAHDGTPDAVSDKQSVPELLPASVTHVVPL